VSNCQRIPRWIERNTSQGDPLIEPRQSADSSLRLDTMIAFTVYNPPYLIAPRLKMTSFRFCCILYRNGTKPAIAII